MRVVDIQLSSAELNSFTPKLPTPLKSSGPAKVAPLTKPGQAKLDSVSAGCIRQVRTTLDQS